MRRKTSNLSSPKLTKEGLLNALRREKRPLSFDELVRLFGAQGKGKRDLQTMIHELLGEGSAIKLRNKRFGIPQEMNLQTGTLMCTRSGNGFVVPDKAGEKDVFIPSRFISDAFHGDRVIARVEHSNRGRKEGKIIKVAERKTKNIIGFLRRVRDLFFLIPEDERISRHFLVAEDKKFGDLKEGDLAACKITSFPENGGDTECKILHVFKGLTDVKSIGQFVVYKYGLPQRFKRTAETEAKALTLDTTVDGRLDLRSTNHVTIDGEFAKDFDDAVHIEKTKAGYTLFVSIADVSRYVIRGSALDKEAYQRGTSIYFPGSVIPMLPKALSNVICSLNPDEDRLAVTAKLRYNRQGRRLESSFHKSVIRSARRLTYKGVEQAVVHKDTALRKGLGDLIRPLDQMAELASLIAGERTRRKSLDFDLPEPEVILDIEGGVKDILRAERLFAHRIIEEFMISANEAVAEFFTEKGIPAMYRVHEAPEKEKLRDFEKLLETLSIPYRRGPGGILPMQAILDSVKGAEYEFLVNRVLLRSMKQARYSAANKGHFGLASKSYLHFTSPIRRYPDLICHRVLKAVLDATDAPMAAVYNETDLEHMAIHLSERERLAMEAERDLQNRIRVLFMRERIDEVFDGIISHITSYGFFVELLDVFVEGVVLLTDVYDDYYIFQEEKFRLIGRRTRRIFRIGDRVRVRVTQADVEKNRLNFVLA